MATAEAAAAEGPLRGACVTPPPQLLHSHRRSLVNVLILGGTHRQRVRVAYEFHRESVLRGGPFLCLDARHDDERLRMALQAWTSATDPDPGADLLRAAERGSLFVDSVANLRQETQRMLLAFMRTSANDRLDTGVDGWVGRILVGDAGQLSVATAEGKFSGALYDALDKLRVELPSPRRGDLGAQRFVRRALDADAGSARRTAGATGRREPRQLRVRPW